MVERLVAEIHTHGLSAMDIEMAFTDATGACVMSRSTVSEVAERLWQDYQAFRESFLGRTGRGSRYPTCLPTGSMSRCEPLAARRTPSCVCGLSARMAVSVFWM